jgi:glutamate-1-semialdehyde 2,1-aminomutase
MSSQRSIPSRARSQALQQRAERFFPGGVNSPVRAFGAVGGEPPFVARAEGAWITDADGNRYIDYFGSWGPMILGHAFPPVVEAIERVARDSASFGASTAAEGDLAERIVACYPAIEKMRFVSSGTEATMSAIRLARAATGRKIIVKFEGCYHGHADGLLVKAGSGVATFGIPGSAGVPEEIAQLTLALPYNDLGAVEAAFDAHPGAVAAIIVEPIVGNAGCILPAEGYLAGLRKVTARHGALLIVDEVMTGFRVALGGACELYSLDPDLVTLGKIVGGGLPVGVFGGKRVFMDQLAPLGPVYQAGTLSGNPLAMAAGIRHDQPSAGQRSTDLRATGCHGRRSGRWGSQGSLQRRHRCNGQPRGLDVDVVFHLRRSRRTTSRPQNPIPRHSAASIARCSMGACGFRPRSLRRPS